MPVTLCGAEEAARLSALHTACFDTGWNVAATRALFDTPGTFAAMSGQGMLIFRVAGEQADLITLAVLPEARRRGVAAELLAASLNHARAEGAEAMFLEVAEGNAAALRLYENAGFSTLTRRKSYYANGEDALLMRKPLT